GTGLLRRDTSAFTPGLVYGADVRPTVAGVRETRIEVTDNLDELLSVLPPRLVETLLRDTATASLLEVVCDLGRVPEARFPEGVATLSDAPVSRDDLDYVAARV